MISTNYLTLQVLEGKNEEIENQVLDWMSLAFTK